MDRSAHNRRRSIATIAIALSLTVTAGCAVAAEDVAGLAGRIVMSIATKVVVDEGAQYLEKLVSPSQKQPDAPLLQIDYTDQTDTPVSDAYEVNGFGSITVSKLSGSINITGDGESEMVTVPAGTTATIEIDSGPVTVVAGGATQVPAPVATARFKPVSNVVVPANAVGGVHYLAGRTGTYEFAYVSGVYSAWPGDQGPWETTIVAYNGSVPIRDGSGLDRGQQLFALGDSGKFDSKQEALSQAKNSSISYRVTLNAGEVVTLVAVDDDFAYDDNPGSVTVRISAVK